jgi:sugar/nucleoside kinase (ribokinase family)
VSERVKNFILQEPDKIGDTTGCGDNFAGGVIASIAQQLIEGTSKQIDFKKALALGVVSGGYACFYHGGTYFEKQPGEKLKNIEPFYNEYLKQINYCVKI